MKYKKLLLLTSSILFLAGCNTNVNTDVKTNDGSDSTDTDTDVTPTPETGEWSSELQTLMKKWCGEVLPYVDLGSNIVYKETSDDYGDYFEFYDSATTSKIDNYDTKLEAAGWGVEYYSDEDYYEAEKTSGDGLTTYYVQYYFDTEYDSGNYFACWNSSSDDEEETLTDWPDELKALMTEWCGEVLPFVELSSSLEYEVVDDDDDSYMYFYDSATTSKIDNYDTKLEAAGWTVAYNPNYECYVASKTSKDKVTVYTLVYYFDDYYELGNTFECSKTVLSTEKDTSTEWNSDAQSAMNSTIGELLPFVQIGKNYTVETDDNMFRISDDYYQSLQTDIVNALTSNEYTNAGTDVYGDPLLTKTTSNGSTITVNPYYSSGNYIDVYYTPNTTTSSSWPSELLKDIEDAGYTVPSFDADSYTYYRVGDKVVISTSATTDLEESYSESLLDSGFVVSENSASTFEETLSIDFEATGDYDDNWDFAIDGFEVTIQKQTPTSSFYDEWPEEVIKGYLSDNEINVTDISALKVTNNSSKQYKVYEIDFETAYNNLLSAYELYIEMGWMTEEDIAGYASAYTGLYVDVYDEDNSLATTYYNQLANIPYYTEEASEYGLYYAEDASGELGLYYSSSSSVFELQFLVGSGTAHEPVFAFAKSSMSITKGQEFQLVLNRSMVPGNLVYESSNTNVATVTQDGFVTINSEANIGDTATITASIENSTYLTTCTLTVSDKAFNRITSLDDFVSGGKYLIVSEANKVAFNSASSSIDGANNFVSVTATDGKIEYDEALESAAFTITEGSGTNAGKYSICTSDGLYLNNTASNSNKISTSSTISYNAISFSGNNVVITGLSGSGRILRYNTSWPGFRYYSQGQADIQLYLLNE